MERYGSEVRNQLHNLINHRQVNILATSVLVFVSIYIAFVSCLGQNIVHPLAEIHVSSFSNNALNEFVQTTMSIFFIIALGLLIGRIFHYIHLPPLLGALLVGIALKNIPVINELLYVNPYWDFCMRKLAFVLIMIRCAVGINTNAVKSTPVVLVSLGVFTSVLEAGAICLAAHLIFNFPLVLSVIFGFLLAATSPAVTVPAMLNLQNNNLGTDKGIPSLILASASIDNLVMIVAYTVSVGLVFTKEPISETIVRTVGEVVVSIIIGSLLGWVLWWFPRRADTYTHFSRTVLLLSMSAALVFGSIAIGCDFAGTIAVMVMCITAAQQWKMDNDKKTYNEERSLALIWNLFFQPLLFVLIGMKFDLLKISGESVLIGLAILGIGVGIRMLSVLFFTMCSGLKFREQLVFVFSFLPKATVQAALAPSIVVACAGIPEYEPWALYILNTCIVGILITAPLGQLFLDLCGPALLKSKFVQTVHIAPEESYVGSQKIDETYDQMNGTNGSITFKQFKSMYNAQQRERDAPRLEESFHNGNQTRYAYPIERFNPPSFMRTPPTNEKQGYHF